MMADEPDSPACLGMLVSYFSVNGWAASATPLWEQNAWNLTHSACSSRTPPVVGTHPSGV